MKQVDKMPFQQGNKTVEITKIILQNVLSGQNNEEDLDVEVVSFNRRNDDHVEFAFSYSDMLLKAPSDFRNISDAARRYVDLFMVHKAEDETNPESTYNKVRGDLKACRTLFHQPKIQKDLNDFFGLA